MTISLFNISEKWQIILTTSPGEHMFTQLSFFFYLQSGHFFLRVLSHEEVCQKEGEKKKSLEELQAMGTGTPEVWTAHRRGVGLFIHKSSTMFLGGPVFFFNNAAASFTLKQIFREKKKTKSNARS